MRARSNASTNPGSAEDGFVLIGVLFLVVVILIMLAMAAPKIATSIKRDKELELYHRGMQYTRAIKLYYKKFGAYPISLDQLENTNNIRFLRKKYPDPFTGKPDWRMIHVGEAKVLPTGLFGQPLGVAGAGNTGMPWQQPAKRVRPSAATPAQHLEGAKAGSSFRQRRNRFELRRQQRWLQLRQ